MASIRIVPAQVTDVPVILGMIKALAEYEQLTHEVTATEGDLRQSLFGPRPAGEVVLAYAGDAPIGFALFFHNFSTFLGQHGLYLEDLFVVPEWRGKGIYRALTAARARFALGEGVRYIHSDCSAMSRPILERSGLVAVTTSTPYLWKREGVSSAGG